MSTRLTDEQLAEFRNALRVRDLTTWEAEAVLNHCTALEAELADVKGPQFEKRCDQIKANFDAKVAALEAELQAAQLRPIQGSLKWSIEKMEQRAIDNFRTKLVAAVREITMTVPPTAERDGYFRTPLQVRDEAVALIEATEL